MNWHYIAGFFDGEGCVGLSKIRERSFILSMAQLKKRDLVLREIQSFLKARSIESKIHHYKSGHKCEMSSLVITSAERVKAFLEGVLPFLLVKKDEALIQLQRCEQTLSRQIANRVRINNATDAYLEGYSYKQCTQEFGVDSRSLKRELSRRGLSSRPIGTNQFSIQC